MSDKVKIFSVKDANFTTEVEGIGKVNKINKDDALAVVCSIGYVGELKEMKGTSEKTNKPYHFKSQFIIAKDENGEDFKITYSPKVDGDVIDFNALKDSQILISCWESPTHGFIGCKYVGMTDPYTKGDKEYEPLHEVKITSTGNVEVLANTKATNVPEEPVNEDSIPF